MTETVWYDLDPQGGELWVVEGPDGYSIEDLDPDALPDGFRWIDDDEWAERHESMTVRS